MYTDKIIEDNNSNTTMLGIYVALI